MPDDGKRIQVDLKSDEGGYLRIEIFGREHAGAADFWDGNWLRCRVTVEVGGFRGRFDPSLRTEEFQRMRDGVRVCMKDLRGTFVFATMEGQLSVVAKGDGAGHFTAECTAADAARMRNVLKFELDLDQTRLGPLGAELDAVLAAYPVVGDPRSS